MTVLAKPYTWVRVSKATVTMPTDAVSVANHCFSSTYMHRFWKMHIERRALVGIGAEHWRSTA
jgi:lysine/ornithine N-monooxygenase